MKRRVGGHPTTSWGSTSVPSASTCAVQGQLAEQRKFFPLKGNVNVC